MTNDRPRGMPTIGKKIDELAMDVPDEHDAGQTVSQARGAGFGDAAGNKLVEENAIRAVRAFYEVNRWHVRSVERDHCGYDLYCCKDKSVEEVEVKGVRGASECFFITDGEVKQARTNRKFVLIAVTAALSERPVLTRYTGQEFFRNFEILSVQYRANRIVPDQ